MVDPPIWPYRIFTTILHIKARFSRVGWATCCPPIHIALQSAHAQLSPISGWESVLLHLGHSPAEANVCRGTRPPIASRRYRRYPSRAPVDDRGHRLAPRPHSHALASAGKRYRLYPANRRIEETLHAGVSRCRRNRGRPLAFTTPPTVSGHLVEAILGTPNPKCPRLPHAH